ncbi:DoxX family protein [Hymenobacter sp.]|uniref:DoxX family protein n=1 Tax=Hymenobacter sp. TaxID=1898978 RepID=UPI00286B7C64|nr:DoxX family protein [Hymenobacter sp.]
MTTIRHSPENRRPFWYWLTTGLLAFGMLAGGVGQLLQLKFNADGVTHLGYPLYLLYILGTWKIIGVIALLVPGYLLVKEWTYAGFFFLLTGAVTSHIVSGDGVSAYVFPLLFALLTVLSWYLRPANRRLVAPPQPESRMPQPANSLPPALSASAAQG